MIEDRDPIWQRSLDEVEHSRDVELERVLPSLVGGVFELAVGGLIGGVVDQNVRPNASTQWR
jgi:hypothetical protein